MRGHSLAAALAAALAACPGPAAAYPATPAILTYEVKAVQARLQAVRRPATTPPGNAWRRGGTRRRGARLRHGARLPSRWAPPSPTPWRVGQ